VSYQQPFELFRRPERFAIAGDGRPGNVASARQLHRVIRREVGDHVAALADTASRSAWLRQCRACEQCP
jgi:hypothetical protein